MTNVADLAAIAAALARPSGAPLVVLARTISGRGVTFMERQVDWHYLPMTDAQYRQALAESDSLP